MEYIASSWSGMCEHTCCHNRHIESFRIISSEKIRTYNQPQDRVTDHRIGFNGTYNGVLLGDTLPSVIDALAAADRADKLAKAV